MDLDFCLWEVVSAYTQFYDDLSIEKILNFFENPRKNRFNVSPDVIEHLKTNPYSEGIIKKELKKLCASGAHGFSKTRGCYFSNRSPWQSVQELLQYLGLQNGKKYNEKHILKMCDWDAVPTTKPKYNINIDNWNFPCSSDNELKVINALYRSGISKLIRGQKFCINYTKRKRNKKYYPDIVFLTKNNYICFIEVKPLYDMVSEDNKRKYRFMKSYCEKNGYLYATVDGDLNTFDSFSYFVDKYGDFAFENLHKAIIELFVSILDSKEKNCYDKIQSFIKKWKRYYHEQTIKEQMAYSIDKNNLYFKGNFSGSTKLILKRKKNSLI